LFFENLKLRDKIFLFLIVLILLLFLFGWIMALKTAESGGEWTEVNAEMEELLRETFPDSARGEAPPEEPAKPSFPLDINRAAADELTQLPGIGPVKAQAIVEYRNRVGGFKTKEDLLQVKGIGEKTLAKISGLITVGQTGEDGEAGRSGQAEPAAPVKQEGQAGSGHASIQPGQH
jgi:competence ComEA-like helix-hairpin-helix protein